MMSSKETDVIARFIEISQRLRAVYEALIPMTITDDEYETLDKFIDDVVDALEWLESVVDDMESEREASI